VTLGVSARSLWNWQHHEAKRPGRPPHSEAARLCARRLVSAEWRRQGKTAGSRPIVKALAGRVPTRLVQEELSAIKKLHRAHAAKKRRAARVHVQATRRDALWSLDATHLGRLRSGEAMQALVVRDVASRRTIAPSIGPAACARDVIALLERAKAARGTLPLALATDNGSPNVDHEVEAYLAREGVVHLRSRPHTPQHNAWVERAIGELQAESGLGEGVIDEPCRAQRALEAAHRRLDECRLRQTLGYETAARVDARLESAYTLVDRGRFHETVRERVENAVQSQTCARDRRRAERATILDVMEECGLIIRTRGDRRPRPEKPENNS
jgi:transposase InsO family protein